MTGPLADARASIRASDHSQNGPQNPFLPATNGEVKQLRDALRALVQWAEDADRRLTATDEKH